MNFKEGEKGMSELIFKPNDFATEPVHEHDISVAERDKALEWKDRCLEKITELQNKIKKHSEDTVSHAGCKTEMKVATERLTNEIERVSLSVDELRFASWALGNLQSRLKHLPHASEMPEDIWMLGELKKKIEAILSDKGAG